MKTRAGEEVYEAGQAFYWPAGHAPAPSRTASTWTSRQHRSSRRSSATSPAEADRGRDFDAAAGPGGRPRALARNVSQLATLTQESGEDMQISVSPRRFMFRAAPGGPSVVDEIYLRIGDVSIITRG